MKVPGKKQQRKTSSSIRLTPFIDVVFLLMIFFILTIRIYRPEGVLKSTLPELGEHFPLKRDSRYIEPVKIRLFQEGETSSIAVGKRTLNNYQELYTLLQQLPPDILLIIVPQENVFYRYIIGTYNTCIKADRLNIAFSIPSR